MIGSSDVFIGVNALDYSGYPDCRPEYIEAFERMANLAIQACVEGGRPMRIHTPLIHWSKAQIIQKGMELGVDYSLTLSCYDPAADGASCGRCDSFQPKQAGVTPSAGCSTRLRMEHPADGVTPACFG